MIYGNGVDGYRAVKLRRALLRLRIFAQLAGLTCTAGLCFLFASISIYGSQVFYEPVSIILYTELAIVIISLIIQIAALIISEEEYRWK